MERKIYYHDLSREQAVCGRFYNLSEQHDHEAYNIPEEDVPDVIEQLKGFVKEAPRFLDPYLWLEELDSRNLRRRSGEAVY